MTDLAARTPRQELEDILDPAHAQAVIEHRKKLRKPLTSHAASLLARQFAKCHDPNGAVDQMILRGWLGFNPEWLKEPQNAGNYSAYRPATKIPDFEEPPPEVRERMQRRFKELSAGLAAAISMDKPRPVQQRDRHR